MIVGTPRNERANERLGAVERTAYSREVVSVRGARRVSRGGGGGALPAILGRLGRNYDVLRAAGENVADPREGFAQLYFDSVVFDPQALRALLAVARPDRVMLGSDDPFPIGDPAPRAVIEAPLVALDAPTQARLLTGNARAAFPAIAACCGAHHAFR